MVAQEQEALKKKEKSVDPRDESSRGSVPIFNLRSQEDRKPSRRR